MTLLLAIVGYGLTFVGVVWAAIAWFVGIVIFSDWIASLESFKSLGRKKRLFLSTGIIVLLALLVARPIYHLWREERAAAISGNLSMPNTPRNPSARFEIGDSNAILTWTGKSGQDAFLFVWNAGLRIESGESGIEVTTPIRDREGHIIAEINRNRWTITTDCGDKNYTENAFEVKDKRGQVVFQIRFLPDRVQIQGEWRDEFGNGVRLSSLGKDAGADIAIWHTSQMELSLEKSISPIFRYPSREHLGEFIGQN